MFSTRFSMNAGRNFKPYIKTCISLLEHFTNQSLITHGNALHCHLFKVGLSSQNYIAVKLLIMYLDARKSVEINQMLKQFDGFNVVVHNCLVKANLEWGNVSESCKLFDEMPERNEVSWTSLVSGLLKCGYVDKAMSYFERSPFSSVFSWTATICGLLQNRLCSQAMSVYRKMLQSGVLPNDVTFTSVIRASGELGDYELGNSILGMIVRTGFEDNVSVSNSLITFFLRLGEPESAKMVFDKMEKRDVISWTAILDMYIKMGDLTEARRIFDEMPVRNEVSWSAMIARLSQIGNAEEAISLFRQMVHKYGLKPNLSCYSSVITALASIEALYSGMNIHAHMIKVGLEKNMFTGSSLLDLYCKCGSTKDGRSVFNSLPEKNVVCWNSMISGYSLNGQFEEARELFNIAPKKDNITWNSLISGLVEFEKYSDALEVFNDMIVSGEIPNKFTFSSILKACSNLASLGKGKHAHAKAVKLGFQHDIFVSTSLVDMYGKSGGIEDSKKIFDRMILKNEIAYTVMIQGLSENGFAEESLNFFEEMERTSSIKPNELILLSVLFACSHCGLIDKGLGYFNSMAKVYKVKPNQRHYTTVVDMLSRSGRLREAEKFIRSMPYEAEANAWAALLNGCKKYGDGQLAERVSKKLSEYEEVKAGGFVLLSNVYASSGRWSDVLSTREVMREQGVKKSGGCSWIEVRNESELFYSGDESHVQSKEIYGILDLVNSEI